MKVKAKFRGKGNVLLVEREEGLRDSVSGILTRAGYTVFACEDGYQAFLLSETLEQPLHLLVAEVRVGEDLSGVELARHLQVLRPGLAVLYLSTIPANPDLRRELQAMLDSYLSKPFTGEMLLLKVEALIEKARAKARGNGGDKDKRDKGGKGDDQGRDGKPEAGAAVNAWKKSAPQGEGGVRDWRPARLPIP